ncbi:glycerophosphodiester phosphodiesterase [Cytobacillus gottheilii]|uniref:glycerophosphodiester phosphodiesterase n=1 Tax=Cytobacillus gottheilii TaxID=859144 RepID=UPI0009BBA7DE|nr:glycerophosphodiester phosphodiesterase family protein [Cytobacillus gottheilii]
MKLLKRAVSHTTAYLRSAIGIKKQTETPFKTIAHRGASGYCPENTLAAFDMAVEMKADYIELDLQLSKDGEIVVIHDLKLDRTTNGKGRVIDYTYEELRQLDAGSWYSNKYTGERILTFDEVLNKYKNKIGLLIELKKPSVNPGIEEMVASVLEKHNWQSFGENQIIIQSFEQAAMKKMTSLLPGLPIGVLVNYPIKKKDAEEIAQYAEYLNVKWTLVNKKLLAYLAAYNLKTFIWTIRTKKELEQIRQYSVEGIATDYLKLFK